MVLVNSFPVEFVCLYNQSNKIEVDLESYVNTKIRDVVNMLLLEIV